MLVPVSDIFQADANGNITDVGQGGGVGILIEPAPSVPSISQTSIAPTPTARIPGAFPLFVYFDQQQALRHWFQRPGFREFGDRAGLNGQAFNQVTLQGTPNGVYMVTVFKERGQGHVASPLPRSRTLLNIGDFVGATWAGTTTPWWWGEGLSSQGAKQTDAATMANGYYWDVREYTGLQLDLFLNYVGSASSVTWRLILTSQPGNLNSPNQYVPGFDPASVTGAIALASAGALSGGVIVDARANTASSVPANYNIRLYKPCFAALLATPGAAVSGSPFWAMNLTAYR